jgi:rubrerythrin
VYSKKRKDLVESLDEIEEQLSHFRGLDLASDPYSQCIQDAIETQQQLLNEKQDLRWSLLELEEQQEQAHRDMLEQIKPIDLCPTCDSTLIMQNDHPECPICIVFQCPEYEEWCSELGLGQTYDGRV